MVKSSSKNTEKQAQNSQICIQRHQPQEIPLIQGYVGGFEMSISAAR